MPVISEAPQKDPEDIKALYLGEAKRKKLLNEFLIPAQSEATSTAISRCARSDPGGVRHAAHRLRRAHPAGLYLDRKMLNHTLLQTIARVNRPYNELKGHGLVLDYYGIFDHLNEALNYKPDELGDVAFPFDSHP
jgi:type I restriction enzyme R subunit